LIERVQLLDTQDTPMINLPVVVYFYHKNDAGYSFETKIIRDINNPKVQALMLAHASKLKRIQKRKYLRKICNIPVAVTPINIIEVGGKKKMQKTDKKYQGLMLDISIGGCLLKLFNFENIEDIYSGRVVLFELILDETKIQIIARIVNITKENNFNVKFLKILDGNEYLINDFIFFS